jgi:hypothetical protein
MSAISSSEKVVITGHVSTGAVNKAKRVDIFDSQTSTEIEESIQFMEAVKGLPFKQIEVVEMLPAASAASANKVTAVATAATSQPTTSTNASNSAAAASTATEASSQAFGKLNPLLVGKALGFFN